MIQLTKKLSQVFLKDIRYIKRIIDAMPLTGRTVIEIGPGSGRMTEHIVPLAQKIHAVEIDQRLYLFLKEKFSDKQNVDIVHSDIRKYRLPHQEKPLIIFGNIPYAISKDIVNYLIENRVNIEQAYITCQKEFIDKLCAKPGDDGYGLLSCVLQYYAEVERLFNIPAKAFSPMPNVDSAFVAITFYSTTEFGDKDKDFLDFLKNIFAFQRKQIAGILRDIDGIDAMLKECAIDPKARPADIFLKQYRELYSRMEKRCAQK